MQETIIDGETGFLLDRDEAMFASYVQRLLSDPDLAARFGANGQEHVTKHWSWDHAVDQLENELMVVSKSFNR